MVNFLISKGAQIAVRTRDGLTPLHCAARSGHHEVVDILVEKGAPIGSKSKVRIDYSSIIQSAYNKLLIGMLIITKIARICLNETNLIIIINKNYKLCTQTDREILESLIGKMLEKRSLVDIFDLHHSIKRICRFENCKYTSAHMYKCAYVCCVCIYTRHK
jgi:hypothetical protein